jgi:type IV pilus assembly protein PilO
MRFGIRELIFVLAMLGLLGSSYFLVFQKSNVKRDALKADVENKLKALTNLKQSTAGIDDLGMKIDELQQAIEFFESKLPQEQEVDKILKEVWQMAEANSLTTKTVKTLRAERSAGYSELPIQMTLSGDFNGFYAFLLQLEKLPRITRLTNMNLQKIDERDGEMTANMTLSIFFEPDTAAMSAAQ